MNGYLLDTSIALLATSHSAALASDVRDAIAVGPNVLSIVSFWEVVLKAMKGKLDVGDPREWWKMTIEQLT